MTLPDGISGTYYVVVKTGGPYEFLYTNNNTTVSGPITVTADPAAEPDGHEHPGDRRARCRRQLDSTSPGRSQPRAGAADGLVVRRPSASRRVGGSGRTIGLGSFSDSTPLAAG